MFRTPATRHEVVSIAAVLWCVMAGSLPARAGAQAPGPESETSPAVDDLHAPTLEHAIEIPYPATALAERASGTVTLTLLIDERGAVTTCEVHASSGRRDLDDAACEALLVARFAPARRGDTPFASRIRFAHRFEPPLPAPAPVVEAPPEADPVARAEREETEDEVGLTAVVRGSAADARRRSAEAVQVVELDVASEQSADLGEVLARQQGIGVRRSGGLGSTVRFSLNGLTDDQIRFFIDGVPLDWMGFPFGIGDVPVNLIGHVEVFRGVVPVRFGSDALGGAVNLGMRDPAYAPTASVSYQGGSFGTHRLTVDGGHLFARSGAYVRGWAFIDRAENDYTVTVDLADATGREYEGTVRRPHDGYAAQGGSLEVGLADVAFADRLSLRVFVTDYTKDIQNNVTMDVPYGEVRYGEISSGALARYENTWARGHITSVLGYSDTRSWFTDVSPCTYDWFRRCIAELRPGEIGQSPSDQRRRMHAGMLRVTGAYAISDAVELRVSLAPTMTTRTGAELADGETVLAAADLRGDFFTMVAGTEVELEALDDRLEVIVFAKYYLQSLWSDVITEPRVTRPIHNRFQQPGVGAAARLLFTHGIYAKASYEWATRLLRANELFGDGGLVHPNLELLPEVSHNANVGLTIEGVETRLGAFRADVNLFLRRPDRLVVPLGQGEYFQNFNVNRARSMGAELATGWTSPRDLVAVDANVTYQDFRNVSDQGIFGPYEGDRIPNRPFFFANVTAVIAIDDVVVSTDRLTLNYYLRYVHGFFRNWESVGASRPDIKHTIDAQLLHTAALTYAIGRDGREITSSLEVNNFTDARAFDVFGVQRPGRAVYFKVTGEL